MPPAVMGGGWGAVAVVAGAIFGWTVYLDVRHKSERRLANWWVSRARAWGGLVGPCSFLISAVTLAGYGLVALLGNVLAAELEEPRWALLIAVPAMLVYAPFVFATAPVDLSGYDSWRSELGLAGADGPQERAIAWWAGPPSLVGMLLMIATLSSIFVS